MTARISSPSICWKVYTRLALFKRYDFVTMYTFRLVYYLLWHIVWGVIRLRLLF